MQFLTSRSCLDTLIEQESLSFLQHCLYYQWHLMFFSTKAALHLSNQELSAVKLLLALSGGTSSLLN